MLQCDRQPEDLRSHFERSVFSINNHPANIYSENYENIPCIQTISFRVTMMRQSNQEWTNSDDITTNFTWFIFEYFIIYLFIYLSIYLFFH